MKSQDCQWNETLSLSHTSPGKKGFLENFSLWEENVLILFCYTEKSRHNRSENISIISFSVHGNVTYARAEEKVGEKEKLLFPRAHQIFRRMFFLLSFFILVSSRFFSAMCINLWRKIDGNISLYWIGKEFFFRRRWDFHKYFYEDFITTHYRGGFVRGKLLKACNHSVNGKFLIRLRDSFSKFRNSLNVY